MSSNYTLKIGKKAFFLIGLGFTVVSYPKWLKWVIKIQAVIFLITLIFLYIPVKINFGPF